MKSLPAITLSALLLVLLSACQHYQVADSDDYALFNEWKLDSEEAEVVLLVRPDNTFHVDLLTLEGIEVEGKYELDRETLEIAFINLKGTDPISSDSYPGTYRYTIEDDVIHFERLDDPIERRADFLGQPWLLLE